MQATQITGFLTQFVRSGANFLRRILRQMLDLFEDDAHAARVLLTAGTVGVFLAFVSCLLDHTCAKEQRARQ